MLCPVCSCDEESILHIFRDCHFARVTWAISPIANSMLDWFWEVKTRTTFEDFELFLCTCWSIWRNRNLVVHENKRKDPDQSIDFVAKFVRSYKDARNTHGEIIAWKRSRKQYIQSPELAEAVVAHEAVLLAKSLQVRRVILEGDCKSVIQMLQDSSPCLSAAGVYVDQIRNSISDFDCIRFCFVPRLGNTLAHLLAHNFSMDAEGGSVLPPDVV